MSKATTFASLSNQFEEVDIKLLSENSERPHLEITESVKIRETENPHRNSEKQNQ